MLLKIIRKIHSISETGPSILMQIMGQILSGLFRGLWDGWKRHKKAPWNHKSSTCDLPQKKGYLLLCPVPSTTSFQNLNHLTGLYKLYFTNMLLSSCGTLKSPTSTQYPFEGHNFTTVAVQRDAFEPDADLSAPWINSPHVLRQVSSLFEGTGGRWHFGM